MTKAQTNKLLMIIFAVHPRAEVGDEVLEVYHALLNHLDYEVAELAVYQRLATNQWEPRPADILAEASRILIPAERVPTSAEAWNMLRKKAFIDLPPLVVEVAQSIGGTSYLRNLRDFDFARVRAMFETAYNELKEERTREFVLSPRIKERREAIRKKFIAPRIENNNKRRIAQ